jgi:hypothetical protein
VTLGKRIWLDTAIAVALALVLYGVGLLVANPLGRWTCSLAGIDHLILRGPDDPLFRSLAYAFALVPAIAWAAGLLERIYLRADPTPRRLAAYAAAPLVGLVAGLAMQIYTIVGAFGAPQPGGIAPMITPDALQLTDAALRWELVAGTALFLTVVLRSKRLRLLRAAPR